MNDTILYYRLQPTTMNPCSMVKAQREEALRSWLCRGCLTPMAMSTGIDVPIQERTPADPPLNIISGCDLGVARKDFLEELGSDAVASDLILGRVFTANGRLIDNWVTFRGRHRLIVRGSEHVPSAMR
jgi:hypothetical protein